MPPRRRHRKRLSAGPPRAADRGECHGGVAGGAGLRLGQRPVRGAEPQREGQRLAARARPGRRGRRRRAAPTPAARPAPSRSAASSVGRRARRRRRPARRPASPTGNVEKRRRRLRRPARPDQQRRGRPRRRRCARAAPSAAQTRRVQLAGVADAPPRRRSSSRAAAGVPGRRRRLAHLDARRRAAADLADRLDRVRPGRRRGPGPTSRPARRSPASTTASVQRLRAARARSQRGELVVGRAGRSTPSDRRPCSRPARGGTPARSRRAPTVARRGRGCGAAVVEQPGSSVVRSSGSSLDSGLASRTVSRRGVVGGQPERVEVGRRRRTGRPAPRRSRRRPARGRPGGAAAARR